MYNLMRFENINGVNTSYTNHNIKYLERIVKHFFFAMTKRPLVLKSSDLDFEDLPKYYMFYVFYYQTMDFKWIL